MVIAGRVVIRDAREQGGALALKSPQHRVDEPLERLQRALGLGSADALVHQRMGAVGRRIGVALCALHRDIEQTKRQAQQPKQYGIGRSALDQHGA